MKKHQIILPIALLGLAFAGCNKPRASSGSDSKPDQPSQASVETRLRAAYGFAVQAPANLEGYSAFYGLGKLWSDIKQSKTLAAIQANPLVSQMTGDPSFKRSFDQFSQNPEASKWRTILSDALGSETFVEFAPGSAEKLAAWIRLNDEMRLARIDNAFAGMKSTPPENIAPALLPYLKTLELPPMVLGFKLSAQKAALAAELANGEKNLPPGFDLTTFDVNGNAFKCIGVTVSKVMPVPQQEEMRQWIAESVGNPKEADDIYQALLARHVDVAYGFVGDYFVVSLGTDHSHLKLASNFGDSILSHPEVAVAADYADKPLLSFSWASAAFMAASQRKLELSPYYERFKDKLSGALSADDLQKLGADLKRLDAEAATAFTRDYTPMVGVTYRDHGLRGETFGGIKLATTSDSIKFSAVPAESTFVWADSISDPVFIAAARTWFEDLSATTYGAFQKYGLPALSNVQQVQFSLFQAQGLPRLLEFYKITTDQFAKSLGSESAFALDLSGAMPSIPMIPPAFHDGSMIRLAYLSDVKDRALLGQSWTGYLNLVRDASKLVPQASIVLPAGIPDPTSEVVDGVTLSYYQPPIQTGDLLPNVATTDKTFVVSTSRSYSLELSKAAGKSAAPAKPLSADFRVNFKPAIDFADKWMALAAQNPGIFFPGNQAEAQQFKKSQPDLASLLQSLRSFEGIDMQVYQENGLQRTSSAIRWQE